jgi:hypothetical protein
MKKLFLLFALIIGAALQTVSAQTMPYDSVKKQIIYTEVVQVPGADKAKLFERATNVLSKMYNEVEKKYDTKDATAGTMMLKCTTRVMLMDPKTKTMVAEKEFVKYKLSISFKDGKYKYDFYDFHIDKGGYKYPLEKMYLNDQTVTKEMRAPEKLAYVDKDIKELIAKLKAGMTADKVTTKEDW